MKTLQAVLGGVIFVVALAEPTPLGELLGAALIADAFGVRL